MNTLAIDPKNPPTIHEWTGPTGVKFRDVREPSGTYYHDTTPRLVIDALERAYASGDSVRFMLGDSKTGRDWLEENMSCGTVGRSTGWKKTALIIANSRSTGGPAIPADCIVRLFVNGREVYRHPKYNQPELKVLEIAPDEMCGKINLVKAGYTHTVTGTGANFKSKARAERYLAFMTGKRMRP